MGASEGLHGQNDHTENAHFPTPDGLRAKPPVGTYLNAADLPNDLPNRYANHGVTGLGPPPLLQEYVESLKTGTRLQELYIGNNDYEEVDLTQAEQHLRTRFELGGSSYIVFSAGGSDEILERLVWEIPNPPVETRILTLGPCFPNFLNFAERLRGARPADNIQRNAKSKAFITYGPLDGPMAKPVHTPMEDKVDASIRNLLLKKNKGRRRDPAENDKKVIYLDIPNNPTGEILSPESTEEIVKTAAALGITVIIDGANGDFIDDAESPVHLTKKYPNVVYLMSFSKGAGMPKAKLGAAIMSKEEGEKYESVRRPLDYAYTELDILNYVLEPVHSRKYLDFVKTKVKERKKGTKGSLGRCKCYYTVYRSERQNSIFNN
jgi:histidinol-phosphate/aromatic aminotransferase/cobyric acid decarboxylase-like protein